MDRFRHLRRSWEMPGEPSRQPDGLPDPEALAIERLEREELLQAFSKLTPAQREVLLLRFVAELSPAEVANVLGTTPGAIKLLQHRAIRSLARLLAPRGGNPGRVGNAYISGEEGESP